MTDDDYLYRLDEELVQPEDVGALLDRNAAHRDRQEASPEEGQPA